MHGPTDFGARGGEATATRPLACVYGGARWPKRYQTVQCRGAKSFVDDLGLSRGVVLSRAVISLRSVETKPFDSKICPRWTDISSDRAAPCAIAHGVFFVKDARSFDFFKVPFVGFHGLGGKRRE